VSEAVRFVGVGKTFPGVRALDDVTVSVEAGSVHALCGENGAGKSTLGKILAGIHEPDSGEMFVFGEKVRFRSPREALAFGIGMVHQELAFCENLSVAENLCLGALPRNRAFVDRAATVRKAKVMLDAIEATIDVNDRVGDLPLGQRQMVQIASAVGAGARAIVFDEPTSSLSQREADRLYQLIDALKARGVTSIYVSHRMDEIFRLCDTVTVLRDGRHVATKPVKECDEAGIVSMMIGRSLEGGTAAAATAPGPELLSVRGLNSPGKFRDVTFALRAGEVLGLAGLVGAGRSEIAQALMGLDQDAKGDVRVRGERVAIRSAAEAMELGIGLVPEDRKRQGLILQMSARANTTLAILERLSRLTFVRSARENDVAATYFERLRVRAASPEVRAASLSGGNQQKLVLAKWLAADAKILILDEPTRGVDVGAKAEIHALIDGLAATGSAILLISSELPELLRLSTRILVVRQGSIVGEVARAEATQDSLMRAMAGLAA
jgi:ABC-type sugar transport system ATPase subunit